ncbi:HAD-IIIC family phosphatase [Rhodovarius lipocyclicus]|uniref:HAD-IIIC family phosphatase n=1 Tax=Rhodovarius lipocyclicus TaxID=268410 RepID=UPI0013575FA9|nr:HAD-IIIC family phosphatase [Rhodovarius lipocyclicus]
MFHDVRLVVWDLDETFWDGTLTEGGIAYRQDHHDLVVALAERGIMSSICSKNDLAPVRDILSARGLWDYFIFPSVDWRPKGERVAEIIEAVQLRPASVLFVDDHPGNRAQVADAVPGIQLADESMIAAFLDHPAFRGKDDSALTRLRQYKLLEQKQQEMRAAGGSSQDFLRQSRICVSILHDFEPHIDRAVELINRTNQLNFTKERLPDDRDAARAALREQAGRYYARAGLISVQDRYGDYGIVGFFMLEGLVTWGQPRLRHFCFSCRILGMGVEQWIYELLGRPQLHVVGEVLSDPRDAVDWINVPGTEEGSETQAHRFGEVRIRGGCELEVLEHFFRAEAEHVAMEVVTPEEALYLHRNHSMMLSYALRGLTEDERRLTHQLGMDDGFYRTAAFDPGPPGTLIVYCPAADAALAAYRHRGSGFSCPIGMRDVLQPGHAARTPERAALHQAITGLLAREFDQIPFGSIEDFRPHYETILAAVPEDALLVVILPNHRFNLGDGQETDVGPQKALNDAFRAAGAGRPNVAFIESAALIRDIAEVNRDIYLHFERAVYLRLYEAIGACHQAWLAHRAAERVRETAPPPARPGNSLFSKFARLLAGGA